MKKLFLFVLLLPLMIKAQDTREMDKKGIDTAQYIPKGLKVGVEAPIIKGVALGGKAIDSEEILKTKQIVLVFYRGEWCPVCNRYLSNLNDSLQYITNNNVEVIVVGPETFENAQKTADKSKSDFILLPDTTFQILTAYDVLFHVNQKYQRKIKTFLLTDIAKNNNQEEATLPVPATYVIGKDGLIKWRHFDYNYSKRASAQEIIEHLK
ncbi:MAG: AhpC/TSA family protein [Vicingus serpentipes]|nr:AhpC/TSA family protein [Vicingus serpentipes]